MAQSVLPDELRGPLGAFSDDLKDRMPGLMSVTVYGSAARDEYVRGASDVNVMVIAKALPPEALSAAALAIRHWREHLPLSPVFATPDYLRTSADVFPLEFMDMRDDHVTLLGNDPLAGLRVDPAMLRHEVEAELKGKLMRLRSAYVSASGNATAVADLMRDSLASFRIAFQGVLRLHGETPPAGLANIMRAVASDYDLDGGALLAVVAMHQGDAPSADVDTLFGRYLTCVERLVDVVDTWTDGDA